MRVESQEIPKGLDRNDGAGDCILFWDYVLEKHFQRVPCTSAQFGEEPSIIEEVSSEDLGYAENEMTVRYGLEDFFAEPFRAAKSPASHAPLRVGMGKAKPMAGRRFTTS